MFKSVRSRAVLVSAVLVAVGLLVALVSGAFAAPATVRASSKQVMSATAETPTATGTQTATGAPTTTAGTISTVCAPTDAGAKPVKSPRRAARHVLLPAGANSLTICSYNGPNATSATPQWGLAGIGVTARRATLEALTRELDALKRLPARPVVNCVADFGTRLVASFTYPSGRGVILTIDPTGCGSFDNGYITRSGVLANTIPAGAATKRLQTLVKPVKVRSATVRGTIVGCTPSVRSPLTCPRPSGVEV